jgi:hypothetical protein
VIAADKGRLVRVWCSKQSDAGIAAAPSSLPWPLHSEAIVPCAYCSTFSSCCSQENPPTTPCRPTTVTRRANYEQENARQLLPPAYCGLGEIALAGGFKDQAQAAIDEWNSLSKPGGVAVPRPRLRLIEARLRRSNGDLAGAEASLEASYSQPKAFGAKLFVRQITLQGSIHSVGQDQILRQRRYHAAL